MVRLRAWPGVFGGATLEEMKEMGSVEIVREVNPVLRPVGEPFGISARYLRRPSKTEVLEHLSKKGEPEDYREMLSRFILADCLGEDSVCLR